MHSTRPVVDFGVLVAVPASTARPAAIASTMSVLPCRRRSCSIWSIHLHHVDAFDRKETGQACTPGPGPFHADRYYMTEGTQPAEQVDVAPGGGPKLGGG